MVMTMLFSMFRLSRHGTNHGLTLRMRAYFAKYRNKNKSKLSSLLLRVTYIDPHIHVTKILPLATLHPLFQPKKTRYLIVVIFFLVFKGGECWKSKIKWWWNSRTINDKHFIYSLLPPVTMTIINDHNWTTWHSLIAGGEKRKTQWGGTNYPHANLFCIKWTISLRVESHLKPIWSDNDQLFSLAC